MENSNEPLMKSVLNLENIEKTSCNLPMIFAEMFKDEINASNEHKMYNGVKRIIKKYSEDKKAIGAIEEFTRVISGGASLGEILQIAGDEATNPTAASQITVHGNCNTHE